MDALDGYFSLLNALGHRAELIKLSGKNMEEVRVCAPKHIFMQINRDGLVRKEDVYDNSIVFV